MTDKCSPSEELETTKAKIETGVLQLVSDDEELDDKALEDKLEALKAILEKRRQLALKRKELQEPKGNVESLQDESEENSCTANASISSDQTNEGPGNNAGIKSTAEQTMNTSDVDTEHDNADEPETKPVFTEEMVGNYADELRKNGMAGLTDALQRDIMQWKSIPLNIGIIGESGSGKSSFINAIRGINHSDSFAAEVGIQETTKEVRPYPHPKRKNLVFWDVPGVGTKEFPRKTYLKDIDFKKYDFYILVSKSRFLNTNRWLISNIQHSGKTLYFIRTHIDTDIANLKRQKKNVNEEIQSLRKNCKNILKDAGVKSPLVYLVDNNVPEEYDFCNLVEKLLKDAPDLKKEAFVLAMSAMSNSVLEEKRNVLKSKIHLVGILLAIGTAIPIPGADIALDIAILIRETKFYKKQFGTDETTLKEIATKIGISYDELVSNYDIQSSIIIQSVPAFIHFIGSIGLAIGLKGFSKLAVPVVGGLVLAPAVYGFSTFVLRRILDMCFKEAERVIAAHKTWMSANKS